MEVVSVGICLVDRYGIPWLEGAGPGAHYMQCKLHKKVEGDVWRLSINPLAAHSAFFRTDQGRGSDSTTGKVLLSGPTKLLKNSVLPWKQYQ